MDRKAGGRPPAGADIPASEDMQRPGHQEVQVESMWDELVAQRDLESAIAARLERGEPLPGFNHLS